MGLRWSEKSAHSKLVNARLVKLANLDFSEETFCHGTFVLQTLGADNACRLDAMQSLFI